AVFIKRAPVLEHSQEDFLREVFTRRRIRSHPVEERKQTVMMSLEKLTKPVYVSVSDGEHQAVVIQHRICRPEDRRWTQTLQGKEQKSPILNSEIPGQTGQTRTYQFTGLTGLTWNLGIEN